jgi:uncharacterized protein YhfF
MPESQEVCEFWRTFLAPTGRDSATRYIECFHFELAERAANALLDLVLRGAKRATASSLAGLALQEMEPPRSGDLSIVTDWAGHPRCVIETPAVVYLPFREVTWDLCRREGEDDDLASWQRNHVAFFTAEGAALGYTFAWDMPVVFEDFRVVYP